MATKEERKAFCEQYGCTKKDIKEAFFELCDYTAVDQFDECVYEGTYTWKDVPASMLHELMDQSTSGFDNANDFARRLVNAFIGQKTPEFIPNDIQSGFTPQHTLKTGYSITDVVDTWKKFKSDTITIPRFQELIRKGYSWNDLPDTTFSHLMNMYHSPFNIDAIEINSIVKECLDSAPDFLDSNNFTPLSEPDILLSEDNKESNENDEKAQKYFSKFLSGEPFSEEEIENILMSYTIAEKEGENGRWSQPITSIVSLCGHTFQIDWRNGLTEEQDNEYPNQPFEVTSYTHIEMVTVTDWTPVVPKSINPEHMSPVSEEDDEEETEERD